MSTSTFLRDRFIGWDQYPARPRVPFFQAAQGKQVCDRLTICAPSVCSGNVHLRIIDLAEDGELRSNLAVFHEAANVENHFAKDESQRPRVRIISLHSDQSIQPLEITEELLRKILTFHDVDSSFMDVLLSFGDVPNLSEAGSSNISNVLLSDGSRNLSYQLRYVEENYRSKPHPYSTRQTGIYHHHAAANDFDLFIVVNPTEDSLLEPQLLELAQWRSAAADICKHPYRLHVLPFMLYIGNWRWYLRYLGEKFEKQDNKIKTLKIDTPAAVSLKFDTVQDLRDVEDDTHSSIGHCKSALKVAKMLEAIPDNQLKEEWSLATYVDRLSGFTESLPILTAKISNSIELHAYALDLKNQYIAANTNKHVSQLAEATNHDTTAVKWLTYLSLAYLPASFVATLYGMNLFLYNPQKRSLIIARNFWLYFATWLPLTFLTVISYLLLKAYHKYRHRWDWLESGVKTPQRR